MTVVKYSVCECACACVRACVRVNSFVGFEICEEYSIQGCHAV